MEFGGRYRVGAPRLKVWDALNDTAVLKGAIPGCTRIDWTSDVGLEAEIGVNLGIARPVFTGDLTLSDVVPATRYTLTGQGRGGVFGMAQASADITLADLDQDTLLAFTATGGASGRIMQLGRALVGKSAQKVIDGFFERFGKAMGAHVEPIHDEE